MSAEGLFFVSHICYVLAAFSLFMGIFLWYKVDIPRLVREIKDNKMVSVREGPDPESKKEAKVLKTEVLSDKPEIIMLEDIVVTHCVSTLDD
ncbi:MAG: hypothetical protein IK152_04180 [Lachnospiraceae bacterium]|nr:hypothetical protein [Lachnospiraceae bacterium]